MCFTIANDQEGFETLLQRIQSCNRPAGKIKVGLEAAKRSIGSVMPAKPLELQHPVRLTRELDKEIEEIEAAIKSIVDERIPPILTIPGISYRMGVMVLAEIGDFSCFDSSDKLLAYALHLSTRQVQCDRRLLPYGEAGAPVICDTLF